MVVLWETSSDNRARGFISVSPGPYGDWIVAYSNPVPDKKRRLKRSQNTHGRKELHHGGIRMPTDHKTKFRIANWEEYQHYKKRNPPWIKLHIRLIQSKMWLEMDDASRVLAVACMLLASRSDGYIPNDPRYIERVAFLNSKPDFQILVSHGFLEPCSDCKHDASKTLALAEESRAENREREEPRAHEWATPREEAYAVRLLKKHGRDPKSFCADFGVDRFTSQMVDMAVSMYKDAVVACGPRTADTFEDEPEITEEERKAGLAYLRTLKEGNGDARNHD